MVMEKQVNIFLSLSGCLLITTTINWRGKRRFKDIIQVPKRRRCWILVRLQADACRKQNDSIPNHSCFPTHFKENKHKISKDYFAFAQTTSCPYYYFRLVSKYIVYLCKLPTYNLEFCFLLVTQVLSMCNTVTKKPLSEMPAYVKFPVISTCMFIVHFGLAYFMVSFNLLIVSRFHRVGKRFISI